jgi:hypothetical protein
MSAHAREQGIGVWAMVHRGWATRLLSGRAKGTSRIGREEKPGWAGTGIEPKIKGL